MFQFFGEPQRPHPMMLIYMQPQPQPQSRRAGDQATAVHVDSYVDVTSSSGSSSVFGFAPLWLRCKLNTLSEQIRLH